MGALLGLLYIELKESYAALILPPTHTPLSMLVSLALLRVPNSLIELTKPPLISLNSEYALVTFQIA